VLFSYKDSAGNTVFSDRPPPPGESSSPVGVSTNGGKVTGTLADQHENGHAEARGHIKDARKHIPKALAYVDYIEYLIKMHPGRYTAYVHEIKKTDPKSYAALKQAGLFQPLKAHQRLSNLMDSGVVMVGDLFAGRSGYAGAVTLAESSLVDYMKKDGALPPSVLGSQASTLPRNVPNYSNTRLGQWSRQQDAQIAQASKAAQATLGGKPLLNAGAKAAGRVGGPVVDVLIGALDPQVMQGVVAIRFEKYLRDLSTKGIEIDLEVRPILRGHMVRGEWDAARSIIRDAAAHSKHVK
jgi:hypothetical protein